MYYKYLLLLLLFWKNLKLFNTHVILSFPETRYPPLDFLDTARTSGQCGLPKSSRSKYLKKKVRTVGYYFKQVSLNNIFLFIKV